MRSDGQPFILIAEDMENDVLMLQRAFLQTGLVVSMHVVSAGDECIAYLEGTGRYSKREEFPLPDLLLLDLKMPRVNGFDVLRWIRSKPSLSLLRVIVLTSSERIKDVNEAYALGANSFLTKPLDFIDFKNAISAMYVFWMEQSKKPEIERPPPLKNPMLEQSDSSEEPV